MALSETKKEKIESLIKTNLREKFQNYELKESNKPFHTRLLGKDRLALYSFIHSLNTNFGMTVFEQVAVELAKERFKGVEHQKVVNNKISKVARQEIEDIINELATGKADSNKLEEIERVREATGIEQVEEVDMIQADVALQSNTGEHFLIDITTTKPNTGSFERYKRNLLKWVAGTLAENPEAKVKTFIAMPYNPEAPKDYNRWTMRLLDTKEELKVGEEFWDFLGGEGAYNGLLGCFERAGIELKDEIDEYFKRFNK